MLRPGIYVRSSHWHEELHKETFPIDDPLSRSARRRFAPLTNRRLLLMCEQKPYLAWYGFRTSTRAIRYNVEIALICCKSKFAPLNVNVVLSRKIPVDVLQAGSFAFSPMIGD